jgi:hypothetical protein
MAQCVRSVKLRLARPGRGRCSCPARTSGFLVILAVPRAAEGVGDALVGGVGLAVDAVGVDLEQDRDAVPGAAGDFGGGDAGVQPQGDGGVPQVVGAAGQRGGVLGGGEGGGAGGGPVVAVGAVLDDAAACGAEDPPVRGGAVALEVGAEDLDQDGRDGDGPGLVLGAVFQAAGLAGGAVVGPVAAGAGRGGGQVDAAPAAAGRWQSLSRSITASDGRRAA